MTITERRKRIAHRPSLHYRPHFDGLEGRLALSDFGVAGPGSLGGEIPTVQAGLEPALTGSTLTIASIDPSSGTTIRSLSEISITFDRPLDPFSVGADDFQLIRVGESGGEVGSAVATVEALDPSDPMGRRIILTLDDPLPAGQYQLSLTGRAQLAGSDGAILAGSAQGLGSFLVGAVGLDLSHAIDLGTPGPAETVRAGRLDVATDPSATALYRFTLPDGPGWTVALAVSAQRDGGNLDASAILYDAQGQSIATADRGSADAPLDPTLGQVLAGGTYYLAVSGKLVDGGTDGAYRVHLSAAQSVPSTSVTGIGLDLANPNSGQPTGLTIQFSGPIDPNSLHLGPAKVLTLVDGSGQSWPLYLNGLAADHTAASFTFGSALPVGTFRVELADGSTLADLSGRAVTGTGEGAGVLGSITIAGPGSSSPTDLGTLWPTVGSSVGTTVTLSPGESTTRTLTLLVDGSQSLVVDGEADAFAITILDRRGRSIASVEEADPAGASAPGSRRGYVLVPGTYTITITNQGGTASSLTFSLVARSTSAASLLDSGLGQGSTTILKVAAPSSPASGQGGDSGGARVGPTSASGPSNDPGALVVASFVAARSEASRSPGEVFASAIPVGGLPIGRPSASFDVINVVGPSVGSGSVALASNQPGLPNGLLSVPETFANGSRANFLGPIGVDQQGVAAPGPGRSPVRPAADPGKSLDVARAEATDHAIVADASWYDRVLGWIEGLPTSAETPRVEPTGRVVAGELRAEMPSEPNVPTDYASFTTPAVLVTLTLAAYRSRSALRVWARRFASKGPDARSLKAHRFQPRCRNGIGR